MRMYLQEEDLCEVKRHFLSGIRQNFFRQPYTQRPEITLLGVHRHRKLLAHQGERSGVQASDLVPKMCSQHFQ